MALTPRDAGNEPALLAPQTDPFGDARVVGLGGMENGSGAVAPLRMGLLRYLVEEGDRRVIGFDGEFAAALDLDAYVAGESDDRDSALAQLRQSPWEKQTGVAFLEWLREFNAEQPAADRVRVTGLAARRPTLIVSKLRSYLESVDPAFLATVEHNLERIVTLSATETGSTPEERQELQAETDRLLPSLRERLGAHQSSYVSTGGREEWERATHLVTLLEGAVAVQRPFHHLASGDTEAETARQRALHLAAVAMADNVDWTLGFEGARSMAVVAPNTEVARAERVDQEAGVSVRLLGSLLADRYGDAYYALGTDTGSAPDRSGSDRRGIDYGNGTAPADTTAAETLASTLAGVGSRAALLDFSSARSRDELDTWLEGTEPAGAFDGYCIVPRN